MQRFGLREAFGGKPELRTVVPNEVRNLFLRRHNSRSFACARDNSGLLRRDGQDGRTMVLRQPLQPLAPAGVAEERGAARHQRLRGTQQAKANEEAERAA